MTFFHDVKSVRGEQKARSLQMKLPKVLSLETGFDWAHVGAERRVFQFQSVWLNVAGELSKLIILS